MDNYVVETSFKGLKTPFGVSKYKLFEDLPAYLTNRLNSIDKTEDNDSSLELINDSKRGRIENERICFKMGKRQRL